jgi:hypothetical protein
LLGLLFVLEDGSSMVLQSVCGLQLDYMVLVPEYNVHLVNANSMHALSLISSSMIDVTRVIQKVLTVYLLK